MKPTRNAFIRAALGSAIVIVATQTLHAQTSTWAGGVASLANGAWGTAANWTAGVPNSASAIALLTKDWTGTGPTFTLGADRTLAGLEYQDTGATGDITGSINAGNALIMAGATPYVSTANSITLNCVVAGTAGLKSAGPNNLTLTGNNTISGTLNMDAGVVTTGSANALGTMTINFTTGDTGRVSFGGGFTYANNVTVGTGVALAAGQGLIGHTGAGGVATLSGTITLSGLSGGGGVIMGSNTVGQELRLNGAINQVGTNIGLSQRDGRVIYAGGGDVTGNFNITSVALIGATNGMPTGLAPLLGGSASATLDLNGFDQTLPSLLLGNAGENFVATVNLGAKTLTLNGNITCQTPNTRNATHAINATAGGALNVGATNRTLTLSDSQSLDDLLITNAAITGSGGITKVGPGTMTVNNVTVAGPLAIGEGGLATGRFTVPTATTLTTSALSFANATTLRMKAGPAGDLITTGTLTTAGTTTVKLSQAGGLIPNGTYPLIAYTGTTPGLAGFSLTPFGHAVATLVDTTIGTTTAIALKVDGNDSIVWDGTNNGNWDGANGNWKLSSNLLAATDYVESDVVIFNDSPTSNSVVIVSNVSPSTVTFNNTTTTDYTLSGTTTGTTTTGIIGTTGLLKTANGLLTISSANAYTGTTQIDAGSVVANFTAGTAIPAASAISVALNSSLTLGHNGGTFALNQPTLTGAGSVTIDPGFTLAGNRDLAGVTWNAAAFTGPLNLAPTTGTMRIQVDNLADIGTGPMNITTGGQIYISGANMTFPNNFTVAGTGYVEGAGALGAIRASSTTTFTGTINVKESAKIGALGGTALIANLLQKDPAAALGDLTFGGSINNAGSETLAITGDASGLTSITVNDGSATSAGASITVNIGNGTATGTIGTVPVTLKADGFKNAILRYDRADGHTLVNSIISAPTTTTNEVRNYLDLDCTGTGFNDNGATITLGTAAPLSGGTVRVGQTRANTLAALSGTLTGERLWLASAQPNATLNLGSTAVLKFNAFNLSESANNPATVTHPTGANVEVVGQLRVAHYGTETSTYNLSGGTLTLSGASPNNSPSTAAAGANGTNGDNNLNTLATQAIVGGGIYLGNDGTGVFNHSGGTVSTNWIVLDNRGDTGAGTNMPDGIDRYNLSGTGLLQLKSTWGMIARNVTTQVTLGGGTVQVDNSGVSGTTITTGPDITIPLNIPIDTVASSTTTLDTNAAVNPLNAFTLPRSVTGTGTLALTGGGTVNLSTAGVQVIAANLTSSGTPAKLVKLGGGTTMLAGSLAGFTGNVTVSEGRLDVPASLNTAVTVEALGTLSGEGALTSLTLNGGTLLFDPNSSGNLSATLLTLNSNSLLDVSAAPGVGSFTALTYSSKSGGGTLSVVNGANYRTLPMVNDDGFSTVSVNFAAGKALNWTGKTNSTWKIAGDPLTESNWTDGAIDEVFYSGDSVIFPTGPTATTIALTGLLAPAGVSVTADATTNYTFTSSAGNQLTGATGLTKSGASTLTLVGANTHSGVTTISGGTIAMAIDSLGSGVAGNGIALSGGGKLSYTGAVAADLGVNRNITVGTGGGILEHNNAAAATITIPGTLSGSEPLTFQSAAAGGGTVALTGSNSGYTGAITVSALGAGLTTLRIGSTAASSITVNYPAAAPATGNANGLTLLSGTVVPASTVINLNSKLSGALSLRSQIFAATGAVTLNGPIRVTGDTIVQLSSAVSSTVTVNGNIGEASAGSFLDSAPGAFTNVFFLRGTTTTNYIINGQINLPTAGSTVAVTDGATALINSTGNDFRSASAAFGTIRLGATNALPTTGRLVIGQAGNQACTFDLNGFDQTVSGLEWQAPTGNLLTKGITNSHLTNVSTFTINQATPPLASFNGTLSGNVNFVKDGLETTTLLAPASTFTGNVTVANGMLVASGTGAANGANGPLGVANLAGKTVTVGTGATLSFITNNIFGNGVGNANLPAVVINGGILTSTRYNTLGNLTLNGGTLTQAATDGPGGYEGYQFQGSIVVGGTAASTIAGTNGRANHLAANTQFDVAEVAAGADLIVSAALKNQSNDFGAGAGSLTKTGVGTMVLGGINTYTGDTVVNGGTLELANDAQLRFNLGATSGTNNSLTGTGTVVLDGDFAINTTAAETLTAGTWVLENVASLTGAYGTSFQVVNPDGSPWFATGETWTKTAAGRTWTFDETTGTLTLTISGYDSWATQIPDAGKRARGDDPDGDGFTNGQEFLFGTSPIVGNGVLMTSTRSGGNLILRWFQRESGATYLLKQSPSLEAGSWTTSAIVPVADDQTGVPADYDRFIATIPIDSARKFVRVEGTEN
jgi:fibronectin-binding autotransporter adhesin